MNKRVENDGKSRKKERRQLARTYEIKTNQQALTNLCHMESKEGAKTEKPCTKLVMNFHPLKFLSYVIQKKK